MLYNANIRLYELLYRNKLMAEVYKHVIYWFYLTGQYAPWNFCKILETKFRFCCYTHCNLYVSEKKKCFVYQTFTE